MATALVAVGTASGSGGKQPPGKQPPANTSLPAITGTAAVGGTLTGSSGSWTRGANLAYSWRRCDSAGSNCLAIAGATAQAYQVVAADIGSRLRLTVTATNQYGSAAAVSAPSPVAQAAAPATSTVAPSNEVPPAIGGRSEAGAMLTGSPGSWNGTSPMQFRFQWQHCDSFGAGCAPIAGATNATYSVSPDDVGYAVRLAVTAANTAGQATAASPATALVQGQPAPTSQPSFPIRAAFYYPWFPETWTVNGAHVFYHPTLGDYASSDLATQQAHLRALQYAGMNAAISSWWGPGHYTDARLRQLMATTISTGSPVKWAVYYENEGYGNPTVAKLSSDLAYIRDNLATSSAYLKVGGKFVVFVYNANDTTCDVADRWTQANAQLGSPAYIDLKVFAGYRNCTNQPSSWHQYGPNAPSDEQAGYSYSVSPGWWRADQASPLLRRDPARWQTNVQAMAASREPWQLVTTFNEWTEGTAVESAQEWSSASGYGTYLDALHSALAP
jgi:hypothetical protein